MKYRFEKELLKLLLLLVVGAGVGCVTDDLPIKVDRPQSDIPINIDASISQQYVTRVNDNGFADGDKIGVFIVNYYAGCSQELMFSGNHADNVMFEYDDADGRWQSEHQLYWDISKVPVDAYGYYPYDNRLSSVTEYPFEVKSNQSATVTERGISGYEASDFLWGKSEKVEPKERTIGLNLQHRMAGVQVSLVNGYGLSESEWNALTKQVVINNTKLGASISLQTGEVVLDESSDVESITPIASGDDFRAIVVPQTIEAGESLLTIDINGKIFDITREEDMVYNPGILHRFTFSISKSLPEGDYALNLIEEAILPWQNDSVSHNGEAKEYVVVHLEEDDFLGDVLARMGLDPRKIINLKVTGVIGKGYDYYNGASENFIYIRDNMPYLEAINMKDLRTTSLSLHPGTFTSPGIEYSEDCIPYRAFYRMGYLSHVVWPDHLKAIGFEAFAGCPLRGSLILPEGLKYIEDRAFGVSGAGYGKISFSGELYLPSTLEFIGDDVFSAIDEIYLRGEFVLPPNLSYIGQNVFGSCHLLEGQVNIPSSLTVIGKGALPPNLTGDVFIPEGVISVGGISDKISSVHFSSTVSAIGSEAFKGVKTLRGDLEIPSTVKSIGASAFAETNISHLKLGEGIFIIEEDTFNGCRYLQDTLTIPKSVDVISERAFANCEKLSAVILPENLQVINDEAFSRCYSLNYIECQAVEPPILSSSAFYGVEKNNFTLVVPEGSVEAYRNADNWREFKRISAYRNFVCSPMSAGLLNKGSIRDVFLRADGDWVVSEHPLWARPSVAEGSNKCEFSVEIDDLPHGAGNRTGNIIFTLLDKVDESGNPITCSYNITQYDCTDEEDREVVFQRATKGNNGGINITFVGDGYSAEDIYSGVYYTDVVEGVEYFFGIEPYKSYREYFNVNIVYALSYDSGVCSTVNIWRDTKFDTTYGAGEEGRLFVDPDAVLSYMLNDVENTSITPDNVDQSVVVCILHSDTYEGITSMYGSGAAVAFVPHSRNDYPNDYRGLIQHEAGGHAFGKLADEYIYHGEHIKNCSCRCCSHDLEGLRQQQNIGWWRNISFLGSYSNIEWRHLIFHPEYDDIVDIYEGGLMHRKGVYRSEYNSCMNNNVPYYSTISRQAIVERIKEYAAEQFSFEEFVEHDSREYGEITRSSDGVEGPAMHNPEPIIIPGSPLDYIKTKM